MSVGSAVDPSWPPSGPPWVWADVGRESTVVHLEGDIDLCACEQLEELRRTLSQAPSRLVLDVSEVTFCDATFAGFVAAMARLMPVSVTPPRRIVMDLLRVAGLSSQVTCGHPSTSRGVGVEETALSL